jgi:hypothetical protein
LLSWLLLSFCFSILLSNHLVLGFLRFCQICRLYSLISVLYPNPIQVDLNCMSLVIMKLLFKGFWALPWSSYIDTNLLRTMTTTQAWPHFFS